MLEKRVVSYYLKRCTGIVVIAAVIMAALYNIFADSLRLQKQLDNDYENIMLAPANNVDIPEPVNINTASVHSLQRIKGIGETKAYAIAEYREEHGGFAAVDDIVNVSGIGENTLEMIRDFITV